MRILASLLLSGMIVALFSCTKNDAPEAIKNVRNLSDLSKLLEPDATLTTFAGTLKTTTVPTELLNTGITVLAVPNNGFQNGSMTPGKNANGYSDTISSPAPTAENIRDHIIRGKIDLSQMQNGQKLKAESGKYIQFIKSGDSIWANGLLIEKKPLYTIENAIVYRVPRSLSNTHPRGTVAVTVYDATKWSTGMPRGASISGYPVYLFHTREDFAATITGTIPRYAYKTLTGNDGTALFNDVIPGKYYLSAGNLNNTDILFAEFDITAGTNGLLMGRSSDSLIQPGPPPLTQPDATPGSFYWRDINGDGVLNQQDYMPLPWRSVQTADEGTVSSIILVGRETPDWKTMLQPLVNNIYISAADFDRLRVMADGYMSQDAAGTGQWMVFNNFSFNAGTQPIANIWGLPWKTIRYANTMISICNDINSADTDPYRAQARLLRAYAYLNLVTYFGDVPLLSEENTNTEPYFPRTVKAAVLDFIQQDLEFAVAHLPEISDSKNFVTKSAAIALLAKTALLKNTFTKALEYSNAVISSGKYDLETNAGAVFQDAGSKELIWTGMDPLTGEFKTYFYNRAIFPTIRYAEVLLINAEANIRTGNLNAAQNTLNQLQTRSSRAPVTLDNNNKFDQLNLVVKAESSREGYHFATLVRTGLAGTLLASSGFQTRHVLLPIPMSELQLNPRMVQNPGY
ncbi:RagB/SusD family nutrient uptake outer membrane protein [Niabella sp.]|uniref:RagB/SusD family nutrient uptake outer membrane protein n=1 Tax=Niabella sp. TaxID=1962976 RepID=UPI002608AE7E|nr:RagB/SusD family nutrient uptake outer membrane protein [Niabella sp.]